MKKMITLTALIACLNLRAQYITIPDTGFVNFLHHYFPTAMNGNQLDTTNTNIQNCHYLYLGLDADIYNIVNLSGIEYFSSLDTLFIRWQGITAVPKLPNHLRMFFADGMGLQGLPLFPSSLRGIYIGDNGNNITSIPPLPDSLLVLSYYGVNVTSLPLLPSTLDTLYYAYGPLTQLPLLPDSLHYLICAYSNLTTINSFPSNLQALGLDNNNIVCLPTLPNSLQYFSAQSNPSLTCLPNYLSIMDPTTLALPLCTSPCPTSSCIPIANISLQKDTAQLYAWHVYPNYSSNVTNAMWYWGDGDSTLGLTPSHTYSTAGHYNICVKTYSSCGDSLTFCQSDSIYRSSATNMIQINVVNTTSEIIQLKNQSTEFKIYPNPTANVLQISISSNKNTLNDIQITDVLGNLVIKNSEFKVQNTTAQMDVSSLSNGVYFIHVGNSTQKFMIQH